MKRVADSLCDAEMDRLRSAKRRRFPRISASGWTRTGDFDNASQWLRSPLVVILEAEMIDMDVWIHMSISHESRIPTWEELRDAKDMFIGRQEKAIQVLPPASEYVNIHPYVLHLYSKVDADPLPDFRIKQSDGRTGI